MKSTTTDEKDVKETSKVVMITSEDTKDTEGDASYLTSKEVKSTFEDAKVTSDDEKDTENDTAHKTVMTVVPIRTLKNHEEEAQTPKLAPTRSTETGSTGRINHGSSLAGYRLQLL